MSQPHFLGVSVEDCPQVSPTNGVTGLPSPNPEQDATTIDVEPYSGIPMHAWKRLQINVHVRPATLYLNSTHQEHVLTRVRDVFWPIFRIEEGGVIPDNLASEFVKNVYGIQKLADVLEYLGFIGGSVLVATSVFVVFYSQSMSDFGTTNGGGGGGNEYAQALAPNDH